MGLFQRLHLKFGTIDVSVAASKGHYCSPRDDIGPYTHVELGFPSEVPPEYILDYAEDKDRPLDTVYPWVPVEKLGQWIMEAGNKESD